MNFIYDLQKTQILVPTVFLFLCDHALDEASGPDSQMFMLHSITDGNTPVVFCLERDVFFFFLKDIKEKKHD